MIKPKELEFKKIKNPNEFNENFVIDEKDNMFSFDADTLVSTAIKFYDTTGCQLYYVNVDLEKAGKEIKNDKDAEEWAEKYVKDLIDDDYAVIYYEADSVEISNPDNSDGLKYVGVSDSITYGSKVSSLFNSKARIIVNEIIKHKWTYEEYYDTAWNDTQYIPLEIARQLFPNSFSERKIIVNNSHHGEYLLLDIEQADKLIKKYELRINIFRISWIVLFVLNMIFSIIITRKKANAVRMSEEFPKYEYTQDEYTKNEYTQSEYVQDEYIQYEYDREQYKKDLMDKYN
ncbi:MAG: hypothetical protein V8S56_03735 [Lachnospiraceae bacterium]